MRIGSKLAIAVFIAVALAHLIRIVTNTRVLIEDYSVPMWVSVVGVVVTAGLAFLLYHESGSGSGR